MNKSTTKPTAQKASPLCPLCRKNPRLQRGEKFWPFCSERCARIDLSKWLGAGYIIPGQERINPANHDTDNDTQD